MKRLFALVSVIMLAGTLAACNTEDTENVEGTLLSVDINPSVEFIVDEDDEIDSYTALNEDGEIVLADLDLEGMNYEEALDLYLEEATELGYIDVNADDNAVYISTNEDDATDEEDADQEGDTGDENTEDENTEDENTEDENTEDENTEDENTEDEGNLEDRVEDKINEHFKSRGILGAAVKKDLEEEYGDIAEEYDIGLGKARLLSRAVELDEELTLDEAAEMNMGDVMSILRADHQERMEEFRNNRSEEAQAFKNEIKDQMRDKVQKHRDEEDENTEDGEEVDFEAIKERIRNRTDQDEADNRQRMEDIKDKARGKMGGNNPFFGNDDEDTEDEEDSDSDETPDSIEE